MITIERLVFNPFQENTYIVYDDTLQCAIIDPGCSGKLENDELDKFIKSKGLQPVAHLYTHCHLDHVFGIAHVHRKYGLLPVMHPESLKILQTAPAQGRMFGVDVEEIVEPQSFINQGDKIQIGNSELEILYTPGHVDGHLCFLSHEGRFVIVGDVLFNGSIGRTDLPTGDFDVLAGSIREKLYTLPADYMVYPGHGPHTTIGHEMHTNPFVRAI